MRLNLENDEFQIIDVEKHQSKIFIKSLLKRCNFVENEGIWCLENAETNIISGIVDTLLKYEPELEIPSNVGIKQQEQQQVEDNTEELFEKAKQIKSKEKIDDSDEIFPIPEMASSNKLKWFQTVPVKHAITLGNSANFSVPGSGKTWMAYSTYFSLKKRGDVNKLLVICPLAAFKPWETEYETITGKEKIHKRIIGSPEKRWRIYQNQDDNEIFLLSYGTLIRDVEYIVELLKKSENNFMVILDEAHHIKNYDSASASAVLEIAPYASKRMVLTGTMMPRQTEDIWTQLTFLYPDQRVLGSYDGFSYNLGAANVEEITKRVYHLFTRVSKGTLDLKHPDFEPMELEMTDTQRRIYNAIRAHVIDQYTNGDNPDLIATRKWKRNCFVWLIQAATDPSLLMHNSQYGTDSIESEGLDLQELIMNYNNLKDEEPIKITKVKELVQESIKNNKKILVWCTFINSIKKIESELREWLESNGNAPAIKIWGEVPTDPEKNDEWNREDEIEKFKHSNEHNVLIANPASLSESISLHKQCHHAIYLDRTYNCGNYIQSLERIHRIGLDPKQETKYSILMTKGTIDTKIDRNLEIKFNRMQEFLNEDQFGVLNLDLHFDMLADSNAEEDAEFRNALGL